MASDWSLVAVLSSYHITSRRYDPVSSGSPGKRSRSFRRLQIKVPSCTKFIKIIYTFSTDKISNFGCHTAQLPVPLILSTNLPELYISTPNASIIKDPLLHAQLFISVATKNFSGSMWLCRYQHLSPNARYGLEKERESPILHVIKSSTWRDVGPTLSSSRLFFSCV
jgi:hypothetical protein